jgi:hypothetical protein
VTLESLNGCKTQAQQSMVVDLSWACVIRLSILSYGPLMAGCDLDQSNVQRVRTLSFSFCQPDLLSL